MDYTYITYTKPQPNIGCVTLNRPERLNAINGDMLKQLNHVVKQISADEEVLVWLLTGSPRADGRPCFSSGVDIKAIGEGVKMQPHHGPQVTDTIDSMLKPSIAVMDGIASTGAIEMALACDFRLVGEAVQISDWHLKNLGGGLGAWGSPTRWIDLVGAMATKEIILTGKVIGADEALRIGFSTQNYSSDELMQKSLDMAVTIASMNPDGVRMALAHIQQSCAPFKDASLKLAGQVSAWMGSAGSSFAESSARLTRQREEEKASR